MHTRDKRGAFSLVELMVAVGIISILASIAAPRYKAHIASSRRSEARANLNTIHVLQQTYYAEHITYHSGMEVGYFKARIKCRDVDSSRVEMDNQLGFRPNNCTHLRYGYTTISGNTGGRAFAPSNANLRWIYPDCTGAGPAECGKAEGDILMTGATDGAPEVCRNIVKYCQD